MIYVLSALFFLLPCWLINTCLNVFKFIPGVADADKPLDNNRLWRGKPILGTSTTRIGFIVALVSGAAFGVFFSTYLIGFITGAAVYFGHALGSFIKRRLGVPSGKFLPLVDHGDYICLTGAVFIFLGLLSWHIFLLAFVINLAVHPLLAFIGYKLKLRTHPL